MHKKTRLDGWYRGIIGSTMIVMAGLAGANAADVYPSKPVTLIIPFPPGGSNDILARQITKGLGEILKQPVVVDYRPGAGGNMGATLVARAAPDGYTLMAVSSTIVTNAASQSKVGFDVIKSFSPVALLATGPLLVAVNNDFPAKTPAELISTIKNNPGKYNYASAGPGSLSQFSTELLKTQAGNLKITHVPYRGSGPALNDLIGNQTQVMIASVPALMPMVRAGAIRGIGITSLTASPAAEGLEPVATALPGYEFETWWGIMAPAGTPPAIVERLNTAINEVLRSSAVRENFLKEGAVPSPGAPDQFTSKIARDFSRWKILAKEQHIVAD